MNEDFTTLPVSLTIAGSDSCAGAGIQADLKTFMAHEVYGLTAITAVVAESPHEVVSISPTSASSLKDQLTSLTAAYPIKSVKTGLISSIEQIEVIQDFMLTPQLSSLPLVVDPVMVASTGDSLTSSNLLHSFETKLFPHATLITPNLREAELLLGRIIDPTEPLSNIALSIANKYQVNILLKGGHTCEEKCVDYLAFDGNFTAITTDRLDISDTHGTGCSLSAAIAANLAKGQDLIEAAENAKLWMYKTLQSPLTFHQNKHATMALNHLIKP